MVIGTLTSNFLGQKSEWIIIDFFQAYSSDLEYLEHKYQKLTYGHNSQSIFIYGHFVIVSEKNNQTYDDFRLDAKK